MSELPPSKDRGAWPVAETRLDIGLRKLRDYRGGAVLSDAEADAVLTERDALVLVAEAVVNGEWEAARELSDAALERLP